MLWTLAYYVLMPIFKIFYRLKIVGKENLLHKDPVILAANHMSYLDPIVLGLAYRRKIFFMSKEELFKIPLFRSLMRAFSAFPVKRGKTDRQALRTALELLSQSKVVGVFPEGTRHRDGEVGAVRRGVALLAYKSGAPIIPLGIVGTDKVLPSGKIFPRFHAIKAVIGKPIYVSTEEKSSKEKITDLSLRLKEALSELIQKGEKLEGSHS